MKTLLLLVAAVLLAGCVTYQYTPPYDSSEQSQYKDIAECRAQANMAAVGMGSGAAPAVRESTMVYCLRGKGWEVREL